MWPLTHEAELRNNRLNSDQQRTALTFPPAHVTKQAGCFLGRQRHWIWQSHKQYTMSTATNHAQASRGTGALRKTGNSCQEKPHMSRTYNTHLKSKHLSLVFREKRCIGSEARANDAVGTSSALMNMKRRERARILAHTGAFFFHRMAMTRYEYLLNATFLV